MAVDEAILEAFRVGLAPGTIRLYTWKKPAVSIGYFQDYQRAIRSDAGVTVVRRPTGGRAVAHGSDLTFSLIVSENTIGSRIADSYRRVGQVVLRALISCGIGARLSLPKKENGCQNAANCFEIALAHEVSVNGVKVLGSAQARRSGAVLQQNSLMLRPPPDSAQSAIRSEHSRTYPSLCTIEEAEEALILEIQREFGVVLESGELTSDEMTIADEYEQRYSSPEWTHKRTGGTHALTVRRVE